MTDTQQNLIWIDMEMSGLDVYQDVVLEVAVVATDAQLNILEDPESYVIYQPEHLMTHMDDWNTQHHGASGLLDEVSFSQYDIEKVDDLILAYIKKFVPRKCAPLCGNSIGQDRRFLYRDMPNISDYLHYRNIDVSSFKEVAKRWCPALKPFKKNDGIVAHRAKSDILDSIEEMRYYKQNMIASSSQKSSNIS